MRIDPNTYTWAKEPEIYTIKELKERIQYAGRASTTWLSIWLDGVSVGFGEGDKEIDYFYYDNFIFTGSINLIYNRLPDSIGNYKNST